MPLRIQEYLSCFDDLREACRFLSKDLKIYSSELRINLAPDGFSTVDDDCLVIFDAQPGADTQESMVQEANNLALLRKDLSLIYWAGMNPYVLEAGRTWKDMRWQDSFAMEIPEGKTFMVYNYKDSWHVAGHRSPNGLDDAPDSKRGIGDAVKEEFGKTSDPWHKIFSGYEDACLVFKYTNSSPKIVLVNFIDKTKGLERPGSLIPFHVQTGIPIARPRRIRGLQTKLLTLKSLKALSPNLTFKIPNSKSTSVLNPLPKAIKKFLNRKSTNGLMLADLAEIFLLLRNDGDLKEVAEAYPNLEEPLHMFALAMDKTENELKNLHETAEKIENSKGYATQVNSHALSHIIYDYKKGKIASIRDGLNKISPEDLVKTAYFIDRNRTSEVLNKLRERSR